MTVEEIYEAHADFVWRTLRRLGVPESDVADATQEVFLSVHRSLGQFEGRSSITTWLFAICRGAARDRRRRAHMRYESFDEQAIDRRADGKSDALQTAETRQKLALLEDALAAMEDDQREVFILFELEGLGGDEIARLVKAKPATVYSRLRLARESFERFLQRTAAKTRFAEGAK